MRYPITSRFQSHESFRSKPHLGLDFAMEKGTELRSIQEGTVKQIVNSPTGLGKGVYVEWLDGKTAIYGHMSEITVRVGDRLKIGELIGLSGNSGFVKGKNGGYHLHFAIKDKFGSFIDPEPYSSFIQEMNHNLQTIVESDIAILENSSSNILQQAMDQFNSFLSETSFNTIVLFDYSPFIQSLKNLF